MNILAIYPGLNPKVNDIANVLFHLLIRGHTVRVITAKNNKSKSSFDSADHETINGLEIDRPYMRYFPEMILWPQNKIHLIKRLLHSFSPDVILCSQEYTIHLGLVIKRFYAGKPKIVVVSEYAGELADAGYKGILANLTFPLVGMPRGRKFWTWLKQQSDAVITCYPPDVDRLEELSNSSKPVYFAPWCNHLPGDVTLAPKKRALA